MPERRPTNSELKLQRLEEEEPVADESKGILELFKEPKDADAPLVRDEDER